jgi:hypothetical protein
VLPVVNGRFQAFGFKRSQKRALAPPPPCSRIAALLWRGVPLITSLVNVNRHIYDQIIFDCARVKEKAPGTRNRGRIPVKTPVANNMSTLLRWIKFLAITIRKKFRRSFVAGQSIALTRRLHNKRVGILAIQEFMKRYFLSTRSIFRANACQRAAAQ